MTTYGAFFKQTGTERLQGITVEKTLRAARGSLASGENCIHWGGSVHQRNNFNKRRDPV